MRWTPKAQTDASDLATAGARYVKTLPCLRARGYSIEPSEPPISQFD